MTRTGFVHQALCYGTDDEFLEGTQAYTRDGLEHGDAVLAVIQERNIDLLRQALAPEQAAAVEFVDALDWYGYPSRTLGQYHDYCTAHEQGGARRVRVIGEPVWTGRTDLETREWMRYESLLNVAFAESGHWIVCPYDTRVLPDAVLCAAIRTHPELASGPRETLHCGRYEDPAAFYAEHNAADLPAPDGPVHEVPFTRDGSAAARRAAGAYGQARELTADRVRDMMAAAHECAVNALRFGGGSGVLRLWEEPEYLVCEVSDHGTDSPATAFPGHVPPAPRAPSGHGMWVTRQLSDLVEERIRPGGSVVRMRFRR